MAFDSLILFNFLRKDSDRKEVTQKIANVSKKGGRNSLAGNLKKRNWKSGSVRQTTGGDEPPALYIPVGDFSNMGEDTADELTEPLFKLIDEVFELRGMMKVFRHSLMTFLKSRYQMTLRLILASENSLWLKRLWECDVSGNVEHRNWMLSFTVPVAKATMFYQYA